MPKRSTGTVTVFYPDYSRQELVELLRRRIQALCEELPVQRAALFGSWARSEHTAASDVDLLVIYSGATRNDACAVVKKAVGVPRLEPHVYSAEEYRWARDAVQKMTAGAVDLLSDTDAEDPAPRAD